MQIGLRLPKMHKRKNAKSFVRVAGSSNINHRKFVLVRAALKQKKIFLYWLEAILKQKKSITKKVRI